MQTNHLVFGILAHVDAGKTTLAEAMLYLGGMIRKAGRVDHKDAFLDTHELEKNRGITIFSKQAILSLESGEDSPVQAPAKAVTLMDTPGHVDFSAEMERTLSCLDYAILVISGTDGVQGHALTLWRLLAHYQVPTFVFINKLDLMKQQGRTAVELMKSLSLRLDSACVDFSGGLDDPDTLESIALCDEGLMETYLETGAVPAGEIRRLVRERKLFPCFFGSALRMEGVKELMEALCVYTVCPEAPEEFGARVIKITRDDQGSRLTHMKVTGGVLRVKQLLADRRAGWEEKADQLRIYSGSHFTPVQEAAAGEIVAVTGLTETFAGEGFGIEPPAGKPVLAPVLTYRVLLPEGTDPAGMYQKMRELEEEDPQLHVVWEKESGEIHAQVMGDVQIEILRSVIRERYGIEAGFGAGSIVYRETITKPVEGVGHFEPLRHYAEVHLLLEPAPRGSGMAFGTICSEDILDRNWQNLILTHLKEKAHRGVLTGAELTDMKITLLVGRAHLKHTEGGDFRQATYRAVRHGLMCTESLLLEPVYDFILEVPEDSIGRALNDLTKMNAVFSQPSVENGAAMITGSCPAATMNGYQRDVVSYSRGEGRLFCTLKGYEPCHNAPQVIEEAGYDPERDVGNPPGSVFCSHGAGFPVPWNEVTSYMHLEPAWLPSAGLQIHQQEQAKPAVKAPAPKAAPVSKGSVLTALTQDKELEEIFTRTYGSGRRSRRMFDPQSSAGKGPSGDTRSAAEYLLVDGYNIIFAWEELRELAAADIASARLALMEILSNYQGFRGMTLILVFDAYKIEGYPGEVRKYHHIYVVYTQEAETADQYIEKAVMQLEKDRRVTVATSDGVEQLIIMGQGALRMSAKGLRDEVIEAGREMDREYLSRRHRGGNYLFASLPKELADHLEEVRLGKKKLEEK